MKTWRKVGLLLLRCVYPGTPSPLLHCKSFLRVQTAFSDLLRPKKEQLSFAVVTASSSRSSLFPGGFSRRESPFGGGVNGRSGRERSSKKKSRRNRRRNRHQFPKRRRRVSRNNREIRRKRPKERERVTKRVEIDSDPWTWEKGQRDEGPR